MQRRCSSSDSASNEMAAPKRLEAASASCISEGRAPLRQGSRLVYSAGISHSPSEPLRAAQSRSEASQPVPGLPPPHQAIQGRFQAILSGGGGGCVLGKVGALGGNRSRRHAISPTEIFVVLLLPRLGNYKRFPSMRSMHQRMRH